MLKSGYLILISIIMLIMFANAVSALIISPPKIDINYEPGKEVSWGFNVGGIRDEGIIAYFKVISTGPLNQSISILTGNNLTITTGKWVQVGGKIILPSNLKPGPHRSGVVVAQTAEKSSQGISALIGVEYVINVNVPYPGKYLESILEIRDVKVGEPVHFLIKLTNKGIETVDVASVNLKIYDSDRNEVKEFNENVYNINKNEGKLITLEWNSTGYKYGAYKAVATITYDQKSETIEKGFRLGDLFIKIINVTGNLIEKGKVGKISALVESQSNDFIDNVYVVIEVETKNQVIQLKSPSYSFTPFSSLEFPVYMDSANLDVGKYKAKAILYYLDKTDEMKFSLTIQRNLLKSILKTSTLMIIIIIVLLFLVIFNFLRFKKYKKGKNEK